MPDIRVKIIEIPDVKESVFIQEKKCPILRLGWDGTLRYYD